MHKLIFFHFSLSLQDSGPGRYSVPGGWVKERRSDQLFQSQRLHRSSRLLLSGECDGGRGGPLWSHSLWGCAKVVKQRLGTANKVMVLLVLSRLCKFVTCSTPFQSFLHDQVLLWPDCPGCQLLWQTTLHLRRFSEPSGSWPTRVDPGGLGVPSSFLSTPSSALPSVVISLQRYIASVAETW